MHPKVRALVGYIGPSAGLAPLFEQEQSLFHLTSAIQPRLASFRAHSAAWFDENFKSKSYVFWPTIIHAHLVLILLHFRKRGEWTDLDHVLVADPANSPDTRQFLFDRITTIFSPNIGFRIKATALVKFWHPTQGRDYSCGFRVYDMIRTLISRINEAVIRSWEMSEDLDPADDDSSNDDSSVHGSSIMDSDSLRSYMSDEPDCPDPVDGYVATLWDDLSGDFQWDKVRAEMIGIVATECMRYGRWATRICLAPCDQIRNSTPIDGRGDILQYGEESFALSRGAGHVDGIQRPPMGHSDFRRRKVRRRQIIDDMFEADHSN